MKMQNKVRGGDRWGGLWGSGGPGGSEPRIEVIVLMKKKSGGSHWGLVGRGVRPG